MIVIHITWRSAGEWGSTEPHRTVVTRSTMAEMVERGMRWPQRTRAVVIGSVNRDRNRIPHRARPCRFSKRSNREGIDVVSSCRTTAIAAQRQPNRVAASANKAVSRSTNSAPLRSARALRADKLRGSASRETTDARMTRFPRSKRFEIGAGKRRPFWLMAFEMSTTRPGRSDWLSESATPIQMKRPVAGPRDSAQRTTPSAPRPTNVKIDWSFSGFLRSVRASLSDGVTR